MTRVAFVEQESKLGGVEMSTLYLAQRLKATDFDPIVLVPDKGPLVEACLRDGIPWHVYKKPRFRSTSFRLGRRVIADPSALLINPARLWNTARVVQEIIQENGVDLVVTKGLLAHLYGGLAARWQRLSCIWHMQDEISARRAYGFYLRFMQTASLELASSIIGDAQSITTQYAKHPYCVTVYNGIDSHVFKPGGDPGTLREELDIANEAVVIGNMARLTDWKGQHILIAAFNLLAGDYPDLHLVLIGSPLFDDDGYEQALRQQAAASCAPERIHFAGYRTDTSQSLASLDIYCHSSLRKDTSPLALLSAMATGLPVIISAVPGMLEVVDPGRDALVVVPGNPVSLADEIRLLIDNEELQERLGKAARQSAVSRFSLETYVAEVVEVFEAAIYHKSEETRFVQN